MSKLTICIPSPGSPLSRLLAKGTAIVTGAETTNRGQFKDPSAFIFYEGNIYGAENLATFCRKLANAAGRLCERYPTIAKMEVGTEELSVVGSFDYDFKVVQIDRPDLVAAWENESGVYDGELQDPASVRLTLDIDYELNGTRLETLKAALQSAIEREIGNGALTSGTDAEVDEWRLQIQ